MGWLKTTHKSFHSYVNPFVVKWVQRTTSVWKGMGLNLGSRYLGQKLCIINNLERER